MSTLNAAPAVDDDENESSTTTSMDTGPDQQTEASEEESDRADEYSHQGEDEKQEESVKKECETTEGDEEDPVVSVETALLVLKQHCIEQGIISKEGNESFPRFILDQCHAFEAKKQDRLLREQKRSRTAPGPAYEYVESTIESLRVRGGIYANTEYVGLSLSMFSNDDQVVRLAEAFHGNHKVKIITFHFGPKKDADENTPSNWDPLLRVLESREMLVEVKIQGNPTGSLLQLYRDHFFRALQQNSNVRSLQLGAIDLSDAHVTDPLCSHLDKGTSLKKLSLSRGCEYAPALATALQHNTNIEALMFCGCPDTFALPILEILAAPKTTSRVSKIVYCPTRGIPSEAVAGALQHCFKGNAGASIQSAELKGLRFNQNQPSAARIRILDGLTQSQTVKEVEFHQFIGEFEGSQIAVSVANLVRNKFNLESLCLSASNLPEYDKIESALVEALCRPKSKLRYLKLDLQNHRTPSGLFPFPKFQALITAATRSVQLERLDLGQVRGCGDAYVQALTEAVSSLKVKEFTFRGVSTFTQEQSTNLLEAFKGNYILQKVQCMGLETQLEFCLNRNRKLAEWTENPKLVPRDLWPDAIKLALEAGRESLYLSLIAMSGDGIGLQREGVRKRK